MTSKEHRRVLPLDIVGLICQASELSGLRVLQHVSGAWRHFSLPLLWRSIDIDEWECRSTAQDIHSGYGRFIMTLECRRHSRRRRSSQRRAPSPEPTPGAKTRTEVLNEWLSLRWPRARRVVISAWPPYNVGRVQAAIATACPQLQDLILEGAAAVWLAALQRAVSMHPCLREFHVTEDMRALLAPAANDSHGSQQVQFDFLSASSCAVLTRLTLPCMAESAIQLLARLSRLLPSLESLHLRQVDAGAASHLYVSLPPTIQVLQTSGQHPLSLRMFGMPLAAHSAHSRHGLLGIAHCLRKLTVMGPRSEEAARREFEQFWTPALQQKWPMLEHLAVPVVCAGLAPLIASRCPSLLNLRVAHTGSFIDPVQNVDWVGHLAQLTRLVQLNVASSNDQFEGCRLSPQLATAVTWQAHSLRTLYLSRLCLDTTALHALLRMLPYLQTLWFTFDAAAKPPPVGWVPAEPRHLRYLIIHEVRAVFDEGASSTEASLSDCDDIDNDWGPYRSTVVLSDCLKQLPTLKRCRLPMFTYPDGERHWLQRQYPHIEFKKYAPPY